MKTVYKYEINYGGIIELPVGAQVLSVQNQNNIICMWAAVDPQQAMKVPRKFVVYGTGHEMDSMKALSFIGTVQIGSLVFHVFEVL